MLLSIIIATAIVSSISLIGGIFLITRRIFNEKVTLSLVGFGAGVMLATAFLDLLPEAVNEANGQNVFVPVLLGVVTFFFMERFLLWFHHHDESHHVHPSVYLITIGDGLHNIFDGIAIAAAFLISPAIGITTTIAIAAHEIPQEIADFTLLIHGGISKGRALLLNFISGLTALFGALVGYYFLSTVEKVTPLFVAFSAGMFIYISCSDLIPSLHIEFKKQKRWEQTIPFVLGIVLMYLLTSFLHE